ncbi:MAG: hypothetical protein IJ689_02515 [Alphaproteobacteria bacterium]|nr:hypothetical protein [Alphaproteobacteria bacterium]
MNKYILMLGIAAVSIGSYAAYAGNSATMRVTATIAHDVSLIVTHDLNMGTLTIDPSNTDGGWISIGNNGSISEPDYGIISLTGFSAGTFTANVPDSCKVTGNGYHPCFDAVQELKFGNTSINEVDIIYVSGNTFKFHYGFWEYSRGDIPTSGNYSSSVTIKYIL